MYLEINEIAGYGMACLALVVLAFSLAKWWVQSERRHIAEELDEFGITINTIKRGR